MISAQASDSDIEDTSLTSQFNPEDWIGKGRKVLAPNDFPTGLALYLTSLAEIPQDVSGHCMPGERLTIQAFLQFVLPAKVYHIMQVQAKQSFNGSTSYGCCKELTKERSLWLITARMKRINDVLTYKY